MHECISYGKMLIYTCSCADDEESEERQVFEDQVGGDLQEEFESDCEECNVSVDVTDVEASATSRRRLLELLEVAVKTSVSGVDASQAQTTMDRLVEEDIRIGGGRVKKSSVVIEEDEGVRGCPGCSGLTGGEVAGVVVALVVGVPLVIGAAVFVALYMKKNKPASCLNASCIGDNLCTPHPGKGYEKFHENTDFSDLRN